jgi:hypothetical protein
VVGSEGVDVDEMASMKFVEVRVMEEDIIRLLPSLLSSRWLFDIFSI